MLCSQSDVSVLWLICAETTFWILVSKVKRDWITPLFVYIIIAANKKLLRVLNIYVLITCFSMPKVLAENLCNNGFSSKFWNYLNHHFRQTSSIYAYFACYDSNLSSNEILKLNFRILRSCSIAHFEDYISFSVNNAILVSVVWFCITIRVYTVNCDYQSIK